MRHRLSECLGHLFDASIENQDQDLSKPIKPDGITWRDYLLMLLQIDVGIEHALMVQYLYAAYSLGGEHVPRDKWDMVWRWQQTCVSRPRPPT